MPHGFVSAARGGARALAVAVVLAAACLGAEARQGPWKPGRAPRVPVSGELLVGFRGGVGTGTKCTRGTAPNSSRTWARSWA
jgi:hypothetical protein